MSPALIKHENNYDDLMRAMAKMKAECQVLKSKGQYEAYANKQSLDKIKHLERGSTILNRDMASL